MTLKDTAKSVEAHIQHLEGALRAELAELMGKDGYSFRAEITRDWRWSSSSFETKIEYTIYADGSYVSASTIVAVIAEFKRRKGWLEINKATAIAALPPPVTPPDRLRTKTEAELDDEIPF